MFFAGAACVLAVAVLELREVDARAVRDGCRDVPRGVEAFAAIAPRPLPALSKSGVREVHASSADTGIAVVSPQRSVAGVALRCEPPSGDLSAALAARRQHSVLLGILKYLSSTLYSRRHSYPPPPMMNPEEKLWTAVEPFFMYSFRAASHQGSQGVTPKCGWAFSCIVVLETRRRSGSGVEGKPRYDCPGSRFP